MQKAWIDILSRAVVENQRIQRMQKSMSTDGPSTGPIKGRPGLVLMPSKTDPRIKRWQKVGEDEGGQVSFPPVGGEKEQRSLQSNAQPQQAFAPRSHAEEIKDLQQHIRRLTLDPNSKEDQGDKYMAGRQILKDVKEHHDHVLGMIKNKEISSDEADTYIQSLQDLDTMIGSWDKAGYKPAESGTSDNNEKPTESSFQASLQHVESLVAAIEKDPTASEMKTQETWKATHDLLQEHARGLPAHELKQLASRLEALGEKIQINAENAQKDRSPQSLIQMLLDLINLALAHLGFRKEKHTHVSNMEIPDRKKVERIAYLFEKHGYGESERQFKRIGAGKFGTTYFDEKTGALLKYGYVSTRETELMRMAGLLGVGPQVFASKGLDEKHAMFDSKEGAVAMEFLGGYKTEESVKQEVDEHSRMNATINAVRKLHEKGIYHGDLHYGNIMHKIAEDGSIADTKIIDYGLGSVNPRKVLREISDPGYAANLPGQGDHYAIRLHDYFSQQGLETDISALQSKYRNCMETPKSPEEHQKDIHGFYAEMDGLLKRRSGGTAA